MSEATVDSFRAAVEAGDPDGVLATVAEDVTFNNPVTFRPFQGRDAVAFVVPKLLEVWQDLRYIAELHGDGQVGLVFDARAGTRDVRGIDLLRFDDEGLIAEITVMVRPLTGLQALAKEMEAALSAGSGQG
jgi:hypothetical protein